MKSKKEMRKSHVSGNNRSKNNNKSNKKYSNSNKLTDLVSNQRIMTKNKIIT